MKKQIFTISMMVLLMSQINFAQDSLLIALAKQNTTYFTFENQKPKGKGWDQILEKAKASNNVLIGEDHFFNEIPLFVSALTQSVKYDNFFCETDPYSAALLQNNCRNLSEIALNNFFKKDGYMLSFFALEPEFNLLKNLAKAGVNIKGTDQIIMIADKLFYERLATKTKNKALAELYKQEAAKSKEYFEKFSKDPSQPMYMLTPEYEQNFNKLRAMEKSTEGVEILKKLALSRKIYLEQSHSLRIQLMKQQLLDNYSALAKQKNLFKYGAVHMPKGESLLKIYDIGNIVHNIADSRFEKSLHIMIVGKSGMQGTPFEALPAQKLDAENGDLKGLKPFFQAISGTDWHCFDMMPIRKEMEQNKLTINDKMLLRVINGYDYLVVIPTVTAATFSKK